MRLTRNKGETKASLALKDAKKNLNRIKDRNDEVSKVSEASKRFRRENHFAEQLNLLFETNALPPGKDK